MLRKFPAGSSQQLRQKNVQRPDAAASQFLVERLDAQPDERRQAPRRHPRSEFSGRRRGEAILFLVRPVAEAILEINAKIFHRLATKFFPNALVNHGSKPRVRIALERGLRIRLNGFGKNGGVRRSAQMLQSRELNGTGKSDKIRRVFSQHFERLFSQALRRV